MGGTRETWVDDVEANLICTVAIHHDAFQPIVRAEHFENPTYQALWATMEHLKAKGEFWDIVSLYQACEEGRGFLRDVIPENIAEFPSMAPVYAKQVREKAWSRIVHNTLKRMSQNGSVDPYEFIGTLNEHLRKEDSEESRKSMRDAAKAVFEKLEKLKEKGGLSGVTTGFPKFDKFFHGFQPSRLYILAARPSMGKSALMLNFVLNAAKAGSSVYVQCLEESMLSFATRAVSNQTGIQNEILQRGEFPESNWNEIIKGIGHLGNLKVFIDDASGLKASQICQRVRATHQKSPLNLVCIDHIQELFHSEENRHLEISEAASLFKQLAKDLNIPVLVLSQLNREVEKSADKRPTLAHLKESGDIEAKADVVFLLYRKHYYFKEADVHLAEVNVAKNRDGRCGIFELSWSPDVMKFKEYWHLASVPEEKPQVKLFTNSNRWEGLRQ